MPPHKKEEAPCAILGRRRARGTRSKQIREATERTLRAAPLTEDERAFLRANAAYEGSPFHKKNPNDFGLTPPTYAVKPEKTLCDEAGITQKAIAIELVVSL